MILRNGKFSGKIMRKMFWKIFRTGKFSTSHHYIHVETTLTNRFTADDGRKNIKTGDPARPTERRSDDRNNRELRRDPRQTGRRIWHNNATKREDARRVEWAEPIRAHGISENHGLADRVKKTTIRVAMFTNKWNVSPTKPCQC
jgi:hypothetical protein